MLVLRYWHGVHSIYNYEETKQTKNLDVDVAVLSGL